MELHHLLLTRDFPPAHPGGMSNYYAGLVGALPPERTVVLTPRCDGAEVVDTVFARRIERLPVWRGFLSQQRWRATLRRELRKAGPARTIIHCGNASPFRELCHRAAKSDGARLVIYFHGNDLHALAGMLADDPSKAERWRSIRRDALAVTCNSRATARAAERELGVAEERLLVLHPGVDERFLGLEIPSSDFDGHRPLRLLSVGRLVRRKGVDRTLEALALLRDRGRRFVYTVVGDGDAAPYRRLAAELGIADSVRFTGRLDEEALDREFRDCDLFVMVSRRRPGDVEGFGIVYLEAGAYGRAVVAGRSGGVSEAVLDGETGLLVDDPDSAEGIARVLDSIYADPGLAVELGRKARERVNREFGWRKLVDDYLGKLGERLSA
ncbi:MAG: glycosyltransferase [Candidatus Coatesbacteria bacterium]|nr:glycosyltransferase [Candidatus Coatesbacteria bacterium]